MRGPSVFLAALLALLQLATGLRELHDVPTTPLSKVLSRYMSNAELIAHMHDFAARCGRIAKLHEPIGHSVRGVPLYVLEISDRPGQEEPEPHFQYIGQMHGTEPGGRQLTLALAEWLCANYATNATAARMVSAMHTWILPTMNPDGYADGTYENANGINLNRDFPDRLLSKAMAATGAEQPETKAVMNWTLSRPFTAAANMHEGSFVVNYPYDGSATGSDDFSPCPDDATFKYLASVYANRNPAIRNSTEFPGGITNGADWYSIYGGMQDWAYLRAGCFEITLELWEEKGKAPLALQWELNRESMLQFAIRASLGGLRGTVLRKGTNAPLDARIQVVGISTLTKTGKLFGDFYRPLAPRLAPYTIKVTLPATNATQTFNVTVPYTGAGVALNVVFP